MRKLTQKKGAKEDPKQSKISNFFTSPSQKLTKPASSVRSSSSGLFQQESGQIHNSTSKVICEVDLTENDSIKFPLTPPKSQNIILSDETNKTISDLSASKKKLDKENSIKEVVKGKEPVLSPEVIPPTPPQPVIPTSKAGKKGVKRKFEFSSSKLCTGNARSGSIVQVKKISKPACNLEVEIIAKGGPSASSKDSDVLPRLKGNTDLKDLQEIEKKVPAHEYDNHEITYSVDDEAPCENDRFETECNIISNGAVKDLLFDDWDLDGTENFREDLNLEKPVRCIVTGVNYSHGLRRTEVHLKEMKSTAETKCTLEGSWAGLILREEDTISILAKWDSRCGWIVTDLHGFVVLEPDTLISSTALVGSLFCMRRAILTSMFRGLDPESEIMVIGSLVHEILQEVLDRKVRSEDEIKTIATDIISTRSFIFSMYSSKITIEHVKKQLDLFVPRIKTFISTYIPPVIGTKNNNDWHGEITAIEDIEENIWATNLGLKGKIDVTVKVKVEGITKILPLELKTGRASMSAEHRGQVILYALMMTEIDQPVSSGLLLYLREGVMQEVKAGVMEKRDLILLRNELLRYTFDRKTVKKDENGFFPSPCLPTPINHRQACNKCPYVTICSSALKESGIDKLPSDHPMNAIAFEATSHLKSEHIRFVFHWVALLQLEEAESSRRNYCLKNIWTLPPEQREMNKNCVAFLELVQPVLKENGRYNHLFRRNKELSELIALNDYLVVSTEKRISIASGFVRNISSCEFTISLERDLSRHKECQFFVDHYESQMQLDFNLTNLGYLLEMTPQSDFLRKMIISFELPVYNKLSSEVLAVSQDLLSRLNKCQKHAVLQALATQHYLLIKGMPGTGKTETLVSLVELLVRLGQSVLVTSHTHSAVDNILRRLPPAIDILRLGSMSKVHPDVKHFSEQSLEYSSPEELESKFNRKKVVGVTCLGSAHVLLRRRSFDVVLVDEATQVLLPTSLRPLFAATRFILVGDPQQLPPLVRSQRASEQGLSQSLFSHLDRPAVTAVLSVQYRMNQCITDLANGLTYDGKLECANDDVRNSTIKLQKQLDFATWMALPLSERVEHSVVVLDSGFVSTAKFSNEREANFIFNLVTTMKDVGLDESQIGVIAPYQDQVSLIRSKMAPLAVEVSTVDTFQGRDKNIVIYSCTRSSHAKESGLLSNHNRLTVAITRAKQKLIFIGDVQTLKGYSIFQKLFSLIDPSNLVVLPDETPS